MRKSLFSKAILPAILFLSFFSIITTSCEVGMGESVDLEAPVLKITGPEHGGFCRQTVTVEGTASDNRKIESVVVNYKYKKDGNTISNSKQASLHGTNWSCDFTFDGDYEVEFEAFAYDKMKNGSDESHDRVMVLIDSERPDITKMSIVRGKYVARLLPLSEFTKTEGRWELRNEPQNKDYFQNESFTIIATLKDKYGIGGAYLELWNGDTMVVRRNAKTSENKYAPEFDFTESDFSSLPKGNNQVTYLTPKLYAYDEAGNPSMRDTDGVLAWAPYYNKPHVNFTTIVGDTISVPEGNSIPVSFFDDDDIKSISYKLVSQQGFINIDSVDLTSAGTIGENIRDYSLDIPTGSNPDGMYWLVIEVIDKSIKSDTDKYFEKTQVKISNADAPQIIVNTPASENQVPKLETIDGIPDAFKIEGYIDDNQIVYNAAIAWLPNGNSDLKNAQEFFATYNFNTDKTKVYVDPTTKIQVYNLSRDTGTSYTQGSKTRYKTSYSKTFKFYEDFKVNDKVDNSNKVFMIAAKDTIGNLTLKTFRMKQITSKPTFKIEYTQNDSAQWTDATGTNGWTASDNPVIALTDVKGTKFRITPVVNTGEPEVARCAVTKDTSTTGVTNKEGTADVTQWNATSKTAYFEVKNPSSSQILNFDITAADKIGNSSNATLTIVYSQLGILKEIDCTKSSTKNKPYIYGTGETIRLLASFTSQVELSSLSTTKTERPYIQLNGTNFKKKDGTNVPETDRRAYLAGTSTNVKGTVLYFEYTVPAYSTAEIEATNITIPDTNTIVIPSGVTKVGKFDTVLTSSNNDNTKNTNKINKKYYEIDSIRPYIVRMTPGQGAATTKKTDGSVDIKFTFNEPVFVEGGTIVMERADEKWYIPPVLDNDIFMNIWNNSDDTDRKTLCGSATKPFTVRTDPTATNKDGTTETGDRLKTLIPRGPYMQYTNGLTNEGNFMVPDITTKFVLDYQYDIGSDNVDVAAIRTVLEKRNYHKATFDATVVSINGNEATLNVKNSDFIGGLINGVEYTLTLSSESFRDKNYNYYQATDDKIAYGSVSNYNFWVGPVATPVIRVNRIATNGTDANNKYDVKGKTNVKIDCVTPGATVHFGIDTYTKKGDTSTTHTTITDSANTETYLKNEGTNDNKIIDRIQYHSLNDATIPDLKSYSETTFTYGEKNGTKEISWNETYNDNTTKLVTQIGDGRNDTCQKIFISAQATKTSVTSLSASNVGMEGGYKTMLHYEYSSTQTRLKIFGSQAPEGSSSVAGWPMTLNGKDNRDQYQYSYKEDDKNYYWVSWQIVSKFTLQTFLSDKDFQNPADPDCTYGEYIYRKDKATY